jgi:hypothetical protein
LTIVIPYKDDILSGVELKFALRSIEKHLKGFSNLVIIGTPPDWYKGEFKEAKDYNHRKQFSIYSKLLVACELESVSEEFIMWNDDHFLLRDLYIKDIVPWYDIYLKDTLNRPHGVRYKETIANTLHIIPNTLNYDIHTPCIYNKSLFRMLFSNMQDEVLIKSYYFNHLCGDSGEPMKDLTIMRLFSKEALEELIKDRLFFATTTNGTKKPMIKLLNELFPNKSRWEL